MTQVRETLGEGGLPHSLQTHIGPLDGLRGWAATLVVCSHVGSFGLAPLFRAPIGNYGVFLFFVLSGFLMGHLYLAKPFTHRNVATYFSARISRIVPLYYTVVVAGYLFSKFVDPSFAYAMSNLELFRHLVFIGNVSVFWSIGPEFQFYFLFPLAWWLCAGRGDRWVAGIAMGWIVLMIFLFGAKFPGIVVFSKLHIFVVGILLAFVRIGAVKGSITPRAIVLSQIFAIIILVALLLPREVVGDTIYPTTNRDIKHNHYYQDFAKLLMLAFVVLSFTFESRMANIIFANRIAKLIGKYSFSIYLLHVPVLFALQKSGAFAYLPYPVSIVIIAAAILILCTASFRFLEEPSRVVTRNGLLRVFGADRSRLSAR
jgi:peptidoglycan/LPS O-acetylase OafA/YrhL